MPTPSRNFHRLRRSIINVGSVLFGGNVTLAGAINIQNIGSTNSTINVNSFVVTGPDGALFTIPNFTPAQLMVGSVASILYDAKFLGGPLGSYSALVTFNTSEGPISFTLFATSIVPEPATGILLGCGIADLILARRRRQSSKRFNV